MFQYFVGFRPRGFGHLSARGLNQSAWWGRRERREGRRWQATDCRGKGRRRIHKAVHSAFELYLAIDFVSPKIVSAQ